VCGPAKNTPYYKSHLMTREEYLALYEKYLAGTATPDEVSHIMTYKDNFDFQYPDIQDKENYEFIESRILNKLNHSTGKNDQKQRSFNSWRWPAAAAIFIILFAGLFFYMNNRVDESPVGKRPDLVKKQDVSPGGNKAVLTLANGKQIVLTDAANGTINQQGSITVKKLQNGKLQYVVQTGATRDASPVSAEMNTITTPRGGQYQIVLADGTKVWLNAASSLKFPSAFNGNDRKVALTGEAYFEVAKNKAKPFRVEFNHTQVEVLGTHFNIMAYPDEAETKTTLVEGSVCVSNDNGKQMLTPGHQAIITTSGNMRIVDADMEETLAWKNGFFIFHNSDIRQVMKQAERWYDVDVIYDGNIPDNRLGGRISKYKNISQLLKNIELASSIHFKVNGNKIIVSE